MAVVRKGFSLDLQHHLLKQIMTINSRSESSNLQLDSDLRVDLNLTPYFISLLLPQIRWLPPWHLPALLLISCGTVWEALARMRRAPQPSRPHLASSAVVSMRTSSPSTAPPWQLCSSACSRTLSSRGEGRTKKLMRYRMKNKGLVYHWYIYRHFYDFIFTASWVDL